MPADSHDPDEDAHAAIALRTLMQAVRAKARLVAIVMSLALFTFVYAVADAGRPVWLVTIIGFFGVILIGMFVALVAFWLHVFARRARKDPR